MNPDDASPELAGEIARIQALIRSPQMRELRRRHAGENSAIRPRNAATLVLVDGKPGRERILMGRRNRALKFMPGALVFPGGAVDRADFAVALADDLTPQVRSRVEAAYRGKAGPNSARALGVAAVREMAEETGILIGSRADAIGDNGKTIAAFSSASVRPAISGLRLLARAITPPGPPRRFDTWFFVVRAEAIGHVPPGGFHPSGELEELQWLRPHEAIGADTREITRVILVELIERLSVDPSLRADRPAPWYFSRRGNFTRAIM